MPTEAIRKECFQSGEVTIVVAGADAPSVEGSPVDIATARALVDARVAEGMSRSQAAKLVSSETGLPRRDLFRDGGS